ncbi:MAG: hypothetical protein ACK4NF_04215, partial [Planctomycetota bacterium]
NLLKMLLPPEIIPDCFIAREYKCIPRKREEILPVVEEKLKEVSLKTKEESEYLSQFLTNYQKQERKLNIMCLKDNFDKLCAEELKFNWFRFKDKLTFDSINFKYEIKE